MLEQMENSSLPWTMPWPGDHIYIHADPQAFIRALDMGEQLGADAVSYSHVQDWEYLIDWDRVEILYDNRDYIMIYWGTRYKYCQNPRLKRLTKKKLPISLVITPVPGFAVYRSFLLKEILKALPKQNSRWHEMEYSKASSAHQYKMLIPKQCLYRHVHGYWLEGFFDHIEKGSIGMNFQAEMQSWYIPSQYDWERDIPSCQDYAVRCLQRHPYFRRYMLIDRKLEEFINPFGPSPFDIDWKSNLVFLKKMKKMFQMIFLDNYRKLIEYLNETIKKSMHDWLVLMVAFKRFLMTLLKGAR